MNEREFDNKIRESALAQESRSERPLWNKKGTWNRIESGLEKKNRAVWWKAAAIIILFLSAGWSYAQWNNFKHFGQEKEMQISSLQQQFNECTSAQQTKEIDYQNIIQRKNNAIDSLKIQLLLVQGENHKKTLLKPKTRSIEFTGNIKNPAENLSLIDSLKNTIKLIQSTAQTKDEKTIPEDENIHPQKMEPDKKGINPEKQTYYMSDFQPEIIQKRKGLKIGLFGSPENTGVEYKSDYSIFKK